jgi:alpha-ketoglutarate-dependent taurine dioxygenase
MASMVQIDSAERVFETRQLSPLGVELLNVSIAMLLEDERVPAKALGLLEDNGVIVIRELGLTDEQEVLFARRLGPTVTKTSKGWSKEFPELFSVTMDPDAIAGAYMKSTIEWHIDGTTMEVPQKATLLAARVVPSERADTQFASTYAAYERLRDEEKARYDAVKVWHDLESTHRRFEPEPGPEMIERLRAQPPRLQPLVWTHRSGRKSLVLGTNTTYIEGLPEEDGAAILADLLDRATRPEFVYSHDWHVGDLVIWDNRGVLHRAMPYAEESGRLMMRVTLAGDEPFA